MALYDTLIVTINKHCQYPLGLFIIKDGLRFHSRFIKLVQFGYKSSLGCPADIRFTQRFGNNS
jgi:hypothetical protein